LGEGGSFDEAKMCFWSLDLVGDWMEEGAAGPWAAEVFKLGPLSSLESEKIEESLLAILVGALSFSIKATGSAGIREE
jgi:hypothetical protein